jgi:hypothetical protein
VHPNLYNDGTNKGTTIYLHALTNKELASAGHGEFYNQNIIKLLTDIIYGLIKKYMDSNINKWKI